MSSLLGSKTRILQAAAQ